MFKSFRASQLIGVLLIILLVIGCAPPREKPNDETINTDGSDDLDAAIEVLSKIKLALDIKLDELLEVTSDTGPTGEPVLNRIWPDLVVVENKDTEISRARDYLKQCLAELDANSTDAFFVNFYLGYTDMLYVVSLTSNVSGLVTQNPDNSYSFDTSATEPTSTTEQQAVIDAYYYLTGGNLLSASDWDLSASGWDTTNLQEPTGDTNVLDDLDAAIDIILYNIPDIGVDSFDELLDDINSDTIAAFDSTLEGWGFAAIP